MARLLIDTIQGFNSSFKNQMKDTLIPCTHCINYSREYFGPNTAMAKCFKPFYFQLKTLENAIAKGENYVYCISENPVRIGISFFCLFQLLINFVHLDKLAFDLSLNDLKHMQIKYDDLQIKEEIGKGGKNSVVCRLIDSLFLSAFATVYKGVIKDEIVAVKLLTLFDQTKSGEKGETPDEDIGDKYAEFRREVLVMR